MIISQLSPQPNKTLLQGLQGTDKLKEYHAFLELAHLSRTDASRRRRIYDDIRTTPHTFDFLSQICLTKLGCTYRLLKGRGALKDSNQSSTGSASSFAGNSDRQPLPPVKVSSGPILRKSTPSLLDRLANTRVDPQPTTQIAQPVVQQQQDQQPQSAPSPPVIPSVFRNHSSQPSPRSQVEGSSSSATQQPPLTAQTQSLVIPDLFTSVHSAITTTGSALQSTVDAASSTYQSVVNSTLPTVNKIPAIEQYVSSIQNSLQASTQKAIKPVKPVIERYMPLSIKNSTIWIYMNEPLLSSSVRRSLPNLEISVWIVESVFRFESAGYCRSYSACRFD